MEIREALRVSRESKVALVGSGGKTTALFQLARQLDPPVVVTTSTHLGAWQTRLADRHFIIRRPEDLAGFVSQIEGVTLFSGTVLAEERVAGLNIEALEDLNTLSTELGFPVLVEADGSRQRPIKAPGEHEPVIPGWVNQVVVCAGLSGIGKMLDSNTVHRVEAFARISGILPGEEITLEGILKALSHPQGGLKNIPSGAKRSLLLNQVDREEIAKHIQSIARPFTTFFDSINICSLEEKKTWASIEKTGAVLLAGGGASRFGQPKVLAEWRGKPLVRHVAEAALTAGLDQVQVVLGAVDEPIRDALRGLAVNFVMNPDWRTGQSSSVRAGVRSLGEHIGGAVFLPADQPNIPAELIQAMVERHWLGHVPALATSAGGKRGSPVLFDRSIFAELAMLEGDVGGRALFDRYPPELLEWDDPAVLLDVDTPEDYRRLKERE